jgi:catalase
MLILNQKLTRWLELFSERLLSPNRAVSIHAAVQKGVPERIIKLQVTHFAKADPEYGSRVAEAVGVALEATTTA